MSFVDALLLQSVLFLSVLKGLGYEHSSQLW
nr:MAG TPA: hypothetical protein [Caudoviricetes sp.]DAS91462.1 MAG TPA: hypothetical protein [Caudoviricetes sp.]